MNALGSNAGLGEGYISEAVYSWRWGHEWRVGFYFHSYLVYQGNNICVNFSSQVGMVQVWLSK